jgi:hypothetical protein
MNLKAFKGGLITWTKDFYNLIPFSIYIIGLVSCISTIVLLTIYFKNIFLNKGYKQLKKTKLSFLKPKQRLSYILTLAITLLLFNFIGFSIDSYYEKNPKSTWWDVETQIQDYGLVGNIYHQAFSLLKEDKAYAIEKNNQLSREDEDRLTKIKRIYSIPVQSSSTSLSNPKQRYRFRYPV